MKPEGYYTSGQFAKMARISVRTVRFYDKQNILKPSYVSPAGSRFYTDKDFARLQQILLLKYLGFSLEDIKEMTIDDTDYHFTLNSLALQQKLVQDRIEQLQLVEKAIEDTTREIQENRSINWSHMLDLIHLTGMEKSLKGQYLNSKIFPTESGSTAFILKIKRGGSPGCSECIISRKERISWSLGAETAPFGLRTRKRFQKIFFSHFRISPMVCSETPRETWREEIPVFPFRLSTARKSLSLMKVFTQSLPITYCFTVMIWIKP